MGELENLMKCLQEGRELFATKYGGEPTIAVSAPGRVNLIGEHTDYNDGYVLPMALPMMTVVVGRKTESAKKCHVISTAVGKEVCEQEFPVPPHPGDGSDVVAMDGPLWIKYVKGVVALMNKEGDVPGFEAVITSCVPLGGGLSSSASLEVAVGMFVQQLTPATKLSRVNLALLCQTAEHRYANNKCGIMDQFVCSMAEGGNALMIDCEQPLKSDCAKQVPMADPELVILVADTGVRHNLAGGEYNLRRESCERVVKQLKVKSLRYASMDQLVEAKCQLSDVEFQRARHVISEIDRTTKAVAALRDGKYKVFGELMNASHDSLKVDYEVSCEELDKLVELARQDERVYGSRMTGGGFGGCTVTLLQRNAVVDVMERIKEQYPKATSKQVTFYQAVASPGAKVITDF